MEREVKPFICSRSMIAVEMIAVET